MSDEAKFDFVKKSLSQMCEQFVREIRERGLDGSQCMMARFMLDVTNKCDPNESLDANMYEVRIECGPSRFAGVGAFAKHAAELKKAEDALRSSEETVRIYEQFLEKNNIDIKTGDRR